MKSKSDVRSTRSVPPTAPLPAILVALLEAGDAKPAAMSSPTPTASTASEIVSRLPNWDSFRHTTRTLRAPALHASSGVLDAISGLIVREWWTEKERGYASLCGSLIGRSPEGP